MRRNDLSEAINDLMDLEFAGEQRCRIAAEQATTPPLQAELLLRAAEHRQDAERLRSLVIELRGVPHDGETHAVMADPVRQVPTMAEGGREADLIQACVAEQEAEVALCDELLGAAEVPERVRTVVGQCREAALSRRHGLEEMRMSIA